MCEAIKDLVSGAASTVLAVRTDMRDRGDGGSEHGRIEEDARPCGRRSLEERNSQQELRAKPRHRCERDVGDCGLERERRDGRGVKTGLGGFAHVANVKGEGGAVWYCGVEAVGEVEGCGDLEADVDLWDKLWADRRDAGDLERCESNGGKRCCEIDQVC